MLAKLILGTFAFFFLSMGSLYFFRPRRIFKLNALLRDLIFNDAFISLHRKQLGSLFLVAGLVTLVSLWLGM